MPWPGRPGRSSPDPGSRSSPGAFRRNAGPAGLRPAAARRRSPPPRWLRPGRRCCGAGWRRGRGAPARRPPGGPRGRRGPLRVRACRCSHRRPRRPLRPRSANLTWPIVSSGPSGGGGAGAEPVVLAVDGGASKTDVLLLDATGAVLGRARGAASNHQMVGLDAAMDNLDRAFGAALADANGAGGAAGLPICATGVYCLAGIDLAVDEERVGGAVTARGWTTVTEVRNDTFAVMRAGVTSGWGIGVVCGTGLNCVGMGPDGSTVRFPSLGELSGDFTPGGAWLGVRGLGLALRAGDGRGDPTVLQRAVPALFGLEDPEAVLEAAYTGALPYGRLPEIARVVLDAASAGDGPADGAVGLLVDEVVAMIAAAVRRLELGTSPVEVVVGGGVFENPDFSHRVLEAVQWHVPSAALRPLDAPPVLGAALLGLDAIAAGPAAEAKLRAELS